MRAQGGFTLFEIFAVIAIAGTLCALAAGPFARWYSDSRLEDGASTLQETFRWAEAQAMNAGEADVVDGRIIRQRIYLAVNPENGCYRVVGWRDRDANMIKNASEFTLLREGDLGDVRFGVQPGVTKGITGGDAPIESTFSTSACPDSTETPLLAGFSCTRFTGKGFLPEGTSSADVYVTNGRKTCGLSINAAGIPTLYRWAGSTWQLVR